MARPYVTGPAHIYVGLYHTQPDEFLRRTYATDSPSLAYAQLSNNPPSPPLYLGTCEFTPLIKILHGWRRVDDDNEGKEHPSDLSFQGQRGIVIAPLTRYNEKTYKVISTLLAGDQAGNGSRGVWKAQDVGRLAKKENFASHCLWIQFPYAPRPVAGVVDPDFPPGYRFPRAQLFEPDLLDRLNTQARLTTLGWFCHDQRLGRDGPEGFSPGDFILFDHDTSALPKSPPD